MRYLLRYKGDDWRSSTLGSSFAVGLGSDGFGNLLKSDDVDDNDDDFDDDVGDG